MSFKLGNTSISELYVGSTKIGSAYLGSTKVYEVAAPGPTFDSVTIGTQIWMAKNLAIDDGQDGITIKDNVTANGINFGTQYYYTWDAAVRVANSITGWHLPTRNEWNTLATNVGGSNVAGTKLKSTSGWNDGNNGTDDFGFTALPVGRVKNGSLSLLGRRSMFWSSTEYDSVSVYACILYDVDPKMVIDGGHDKSNPIYSVRLIKDT